MYVLTILTVLSFLIYFLKYGDSCTSIFIEKKEWIMTDNKMKGIIYCPNTSVIYSEKLFILEIKICFFLILFKH